METPKYTCLKLEIPTGGSELEPVFLKGTWYPTRFDLSVTDGLRAWTCHATEEEVRERASYWDQTVSDYVDLAERYLGFQQPGSVYGFSDAGNDCKRLSWTFEKEGTKLEWRWKCHPSPDNKKTTLEILDFLMDANIRLSEEVVWKTQSFDKLKLEVEKCLAQSEKLLSEKSEFESEVYPKFVKVLNSKKAKLRELRDRLSKQGTTDQFPEEEVEEENSADRTESFDEGSDEEAEKNTGASASRDAPTGSKPPRGIKKEISIVPDLMTSYIPQEILLNIFSWLPAKSVGKCRCLAKQWRTLLSAPEFIKSHLTRRPHQENIILISEDYFIVSIKKDVVCRKLEFEPHCSDVLGSCDGLVLLGNTANDLRGSCLINPLTQWHMEIPEPPLVGEHKVSFGMLGFGYDRISDDYKVVTTYYDFFEEEQFLDVYSVKRGIWKRIGVSPYISHSCGVFVNGAIHWLVRGDTVIAVFNLEAEVFHEIPVPACICVYGIEELVLLDGCLCIIGRDDNKEADDRAYGWLKKEYCLEESWTKFTTNDGDHRLQKPLCFISDEEVVWLTCCLKNLVIYNLKEGTMRDIVLDIAPFRCAMGDTFVESLVSPAQ